jgi:hypothetical protein
MVFSNSPETPDISNIDCSNDFKSVNVEELQSIHYELMQRCIFALNYTSKKEFPLETTFLQKDSSFSTQSISNLDRFRKIINKFIDIPSFIFYLYPFTTIYNYLKLNKTENWFFHFINYIFILLLFVMLMLVLAPFMLVHSIKIFQLKIIILFMIKSYIKNINSNLSVSYSRLKTTVNSNEIFDLKYDFRFWLTKSVNDCKNFNDTLATVSNSNIALKLFSFFIAILPNILKNSIVFDWIKIIVSQLPFSNLIDMKWLVLLFLYLPTSVILLILIQSYRAKMFILKQSGIYKLEYRIYKALNYDANNPLIDDLLSLKSLIQIFFIVTALLLFLSPVLDITIQAKFLLTIGLLGGVLNLQTSKSKFKEKEIVEPTNDEILL